MGKINLNLCANYSNNKLKSAISNCMLCDHIIEKLGLSIKRFNKEDLDLFYIHEDFKKAIDKSDNVTFSGIEEWEENKVSSYQDCLQVVAALDKLASDEGKINAGELIEEFAEDTQDYSLALSLCDITYEYLDFGTLEVKPEYVDGLLAELRLVDEGQFLTDLGTMKLDMVPLDIKNYRNKFIEQKLKRSWAILDSVEKTLDKEFDRLHDEIADAYRKFYKITYAALDDGEKVDAARKVCKLIPPHRVILDKLENKLTEANELKRQLTIHEKKLMEQKTAKFEEFDATLQEKPYELDAINREKDSLIFVTDEYLDKIKQTKEEINEVEEEISERYKIIDRVEIALKAAIPSENEMKRYSSLTFKFEDLFTRLELAKSQIKDKDKDFTMAINTAVNGLLILAKIGQEGKDVFMRNTLLSAVFNSVNGIYDLVDNKNKSVELSQIKFVTSRLVRYSLLNNSLTKNLQTFRHVCNNAIRDVAMYMGKPFNLATMVDIVDTIDLAIRQIQELVNKLNENHVEQTRLLSDILNV